MLPVVRQTTAWSCFAASLAMVTGIDYEIMPKDQDTAPGSFPLGDGEWTIDPDTAGPVAEDWVTIWDWGEALADAYQMSMSARYVPKRKGILSLTMLDEYGMGEWSHAVAVDEHGYVTCPSATFDEATVDELENSCNIAIGGFVMVEEK